MDFKGKKILVYGAGKSGIGAVELLAKLGAEPVLFDQKEGITPDDLIGKIGEESVSYKVLNEGRKITGTPDSTENARAVWQAIIKDHIVAETKSDEDSKIVLPAGSYLQVGKTKLAVKTDAVIDNITDPEALEEQLRAALTLEEAEEAIENLVIYVEPGTELWLGNSKASLAEDQDAKITIDINGYEESICKSAGAFRNVLPHHHLAQRNCYRCRADARRRCRKRDAVRLAVFSRCNHCRNARVVHHVRFRAV